MTPRAVLPKVLSLSLSLSLTLTVLLGLVGMTPPAIAQETGRTVGQGADSVVFADGFEGLQILRTVISPDPLDPLISRVEFATNGPDQLQAVEYYGAKDGEGFVAESAVLYLTGQAQPAYIHFDTLGRPDQLLGFDGGAVKFDYQGDTVFAHFLTPDGQTGVTWLPLDQELQGRLADIVANGVTGRPSPDDRPDDGADDGARVASQTETAAPNAPTVSPKNGDTTAVTISRLLRVDVAFEDASGNALAPDVRPLGDVSCPPFDCRISNTYYYRSTSGLFRRLLRIDVRISAEVDVANTEILRLDRVCDNVLRDQNILHTAGGLVVSIGGKLAALCSPPVRAFSLLFSLIGDYTAINSIRTAGAIDCQKIARQALAIEQLRQQSTEVRINLADGVLSELDQSVILFRQFQNGAPFTPFSDSGPWQPDVITITGNDTSQKSSAGRAAEQIPTARAAGSPAARPFEQCFACPLGSQTSLSRPAPFYAPSGYESRCPTGTGPLWELVGEPSINPGGLPLRLDETSGGGAGSHVQCQISAGSISGQVMNIFGDEEIGRAQATYTFDSPPAYFPIAESTEPLAMRLNASAQVKEVPCPTYTAQYLRNRGGIRSSTIAANGCSIANGGQSLFNNSVVLAQNGGDELVIGSELIINGIAGTLRCQVEWEYVRLQARE